MSVVSTGLMRLAPGEGRADSSLRFYQTAASRFFVLRQRGAFPDICYDHARLLAREIEDGIFPEVLDTVAVDTDSDSDGMARVFDAIYARITEDMAEAVEPEFRAGLAALGAGYLDASDDGRFSRAEVRSAALAIDAGNIATGLTRRLAKPLAAEAFPTFLYVARALRTRLRRSGDVEAEISARRAEVAEGLERQARRRLRVGMGCTGFAAGPAYCADGRMLHARNFDGAFFSWNRHPGLFLIDETPANASYLRYAAVGTAGLPYPGGISGMNEAGLSVSLHQMSTVHYATGRSGGGFAIAPYAQQRILREARTLDEAVDLVRGLRHFAAWTIVVSDAAAGKALRIEMAGAEDERGAYVGRVAASAPDPLLAQSNHFLDPALAEKRDYYSDAHFTHSVGKWLETRARLDTTRARLADQASVKAVDEDFAINLLADHHDAALGNGLRSFGRTICKAYSLASTIMRADPDRARGADSIWFTLGERLPGPHSQLVGFDIDWGAFDARPALNAPLRRAQSVNPGWLAAMTAYVAAHETMWRPRIGGALLGAEPSPAQARVIRDRAIRHLERAVEVAAAHGVRDSVFLYALARMSHADGRYDEAAAAWASLRSHAGPTLDYERALVAICASATAFAQGFAAEAEALLNDGAVALEAAADRLFPNGPTHQGVKDWRSVIDALRAEGADARLPEFDWVTVE